MDFTFYFWQINPIKPAIKYLLSVILIAWASLTARSQSAQVKSLEGQIYRLNNNGHYEQSIMLVRQFLDSPGTSSQEAYYGNLYLSETYKRLFDYDNVLLYLDKALTCTNQIKENKQYYIDNVTAQKAFALFDIQKYSLAESLMHELAENQYINLDPKTQAMLIMQQGYLGYLDKAYALAERQYDTAIAKMQVSSPCDLPIIYAKKISLYGAMGREDRMLACYRLAQRHADSCHIVKYNLYATEIMRNTYESMGNYVKAFWYFTKFDSLNTIYNAAGYKDKLKELEVKYETSKKEQALSLQRQTIVSDKRLIAFLITAVVGLVLVVALTITIYQRKKSLREKQTTQRFTRQLLEKTEEERKRIATDLHDSVNNELLLIKSNVDTNPQAIKPKIDDLIDQVRTISRNLHPVLFEELGLQDSIEQLAERVQEHNRFILNTEITYTENTLAAGDALQLYRIIQEAVSNMLKYSNAVAGFISVKQSKEGIAVQIKDNGMGFNVEEVLNGKKAFGLHNILERSRAINGIPKIVSGKGGTHIHIEILLT